jgi:hypothetical protein
VEQSDSRRLTTAGSISKNGHVPKLCPKLLAAYSAEKRLKTDLYCNGCLCCVMNRGC